jgi:hypothetical protein
MPNHFQSCTKLVCTPREPNCLLGRTRHSKPQLFKIFWCNDDAVITLPIQYTSKTCFRVSQALCNPLPQEALHTKCDEPRAYYDTVSRSLGRTEDVLNLRSKAIAFWVLQWIIFLHARCRLYRGEM